MQSRMRHLWECCRSPTNHQSSIDGLSPPALYSHLPKNRAEGVSAQGVGGGRAQTPGHRTCGDLRREDLHRPFGT
jgi:hypothetical protein